MPKPNLSIQELAKVAEAIRANGGPNNFANVPLTRTKTGKIILVTADGKTQVLVA